MQCSYHGLSNQGIVKATFPVSATYKSPKDRKTPDESFVVQYDCELISYPHLSTAHPFL